jgi:aminomethyltransferase
MAIVEPGAPDALTIDVRGRPIAATRTALPFIPHRYVRKGAA